jgi:hypothetical protein
MYIWIYILLSILKYSCYLIIYIIYNNMNVDSDGRTDFQTSAAKLGRPPRVPTQPPLPPQTHSVGVGHRQLHPQIPMGGGPSPALWVCPHFFCGHILDPPPRVEGAPAASRCGLLLGPRPPIESLKHIIKSIHTIKAWITTTKSINI